MSIFKDPSAAVDQIMRDNLTMVAVGGIAGKTLDPEYVLGKLKAAEANAARQLKVLFEPTKVLPDDAPEAEIAALEAASTPYALEAARDYDADFFDGDRWGDVYVGFKPLISVEKVEFAYPFAGNPLYTVPPDWIRFDRRAGLVRFIPVSSFIGGQLAAFRMQLLSAGRMMPFAIRMHYTAGLRNAERDYPDLLNVIKKMAVLLIVEDLFMPQSGSISADGLSQSMSADVEKYQDVIDRALFGPKGSNGGLYTALHGIRMGVL